MGWVDEYLVIDLFRNKTVCYLTLYDGLQVIHYIPASEKRDKDSSELLRKSPSSSPVLVESVHTSSEDKDQVLAGLEGNTNIDCYLIVPLHLNVLLEPDITIHVGTKEIHSCSRS